MKDEFLTEVDVRLSARRDRVNAIRFKSNLRRSQWYGSHEGLQEKIVPPPGYYIHCLHGSSANGACVSLGGYFVPHAFAKSEQSPYRDRGISKAIGTAIIDRSLHGSFWFFSDRVKALVISLTPNLARLRSLTPVEFERYLATTDSPLKKGDLLFVLVENELLEELRACVGDDGCISPIQWVTTRRTTEWFGPGPSDGSTIESRAISDQPGATHIGGFEGMRVHERIQALVVYYCRTRDM